MIPIYIMTQTTQKEKKQKNKTKKKPPKITKGKKVNY